MSARNYCFTWNNYTDFDLTLVLDTKCQYMVVGKEVGDSGTPHLQGYIEFKSSKRITTLKKEWGNAPHFEKRRGTAKQAADYCKKDGDYIEIGEISQQGKRSDLTEIATMAMNKDVPIKDIVEENPKAGLLYVRRIKELRLLAYEDRKEPPTVVWIWGNTGVGKTRTAFDIHDSIYIKDGTMWWDGYEQQEAIVIDDFDGRWPIRDLLRLLDRYPYQGQVKGGYVKINSPYIYITCDRQLDTFWGEPERSQIRRRISYEFHYE